MIEFYPQIKAVHIAAASLSGALFAIRVSASLAGCRWPRVAPLRYFSYTVDTVLLTAAMMLLTILPRELFGNGWLTLKVALVVAYIVLGIVAMRPTLPRRRRVIAFAAAVLVFAQILCIARAHHPLGAFYLLGG